MKLIWTALGVAVTAVAAGLVWLAGQPAEPREPMPRAPIVAPAVTGSPAVPGTQQPVPSPDSGGTVPPPPAYDDDQDGDDQDGDDRDDDDDHDDHDDGDSRDDDRDDGDDGDDR